MSMFGFMNDFEDDPIFGHHMRSMRQMNSMMNSMFADPFGMFNPFDNMQGPSALTGGGPAMITQFPQHNHRNAAAQMMPFGFNSMPNINRLLNPQMPDGSTSYSSSQIISMTNGPDGRPQVYQASSSTKTGPGGIRETQKTVQDSRSGMKKMAIGHHIGERSHVIEREKNVRTGEEAERQDFVNLEEEEAEDFDREFVHRSRSMIGINNGGGRRNHGDIPAIMPSQSQAAIMPPASASPRSNISSNAAKRRTSRQLATPRRPLRTPISSPLALPTTTTYTSPTTSIHPHPYHAPSRRANRPMKGAQHQQQQQQQQQHQQNQK